MTLNHVVEGSSPSAGVWRRQRDYYNPYPLPGRGLTFLKVNFEIKFILIVKMSKQTTRIFGDNSPILRFGMGRNMPYGCPPLVPQISVGGAKNFCAKCGEGLGGMLSSCYKKGCGWSSTSQTHMANCAIRQHGEEMDRLSLTDFCEWSAAYFDDKNVTRRLLKSLPPKEITIGRLIEAELYEENGQKDGVVMLASGLQYKASVAELKKTIMALYEELQDEGERHDLDRAIEDSRRLQKDAMTKASKGGGW